MPRASERAHALRRLVREELAPVAEPARAAGMQRYMKSAMPYLGVTAPRLRAACRRAFADWTFASANAWQADVLALWRGAEVREERYAAVALTGVRAAAEFQTMDALPLYETLVV